MLSFSKFLMNRFNPFTPECLKKTLPFLFTDANRGFNLKSKKMENSVDPDETVSSGSTLFAQVLVLVYRTERVDKTVSASFYI